MHIAYVGSIVDEDKVFMFSGGSIAGNKYQTSLVSGLEAMGNECVRFTLLPLASFPRSKRILIRKRFCGTGAGNSRVIPYINILGLKQISVLICLSLMLLRWAFCTRKLSDRVLLVFNTMSFLTIPVLLTSALYGIKKIAIAVDIAPLQPKRFLERMEAKFETGVLKKLDGIIQITEHITKDFASRVPGIVVEGGVNEILPCVPPPERNRIPILLYTGALDENSGIGILLDAMRLLAGMELELWIAGKGIYTGLVKEAQRADGRICYYGYVDNSVALQLQQKADVLLCPRLPDGYVTKYTFPSKLFEYLLSGKPCICFRLEGLTEDITRILFIPDQNSAEALAGKIKEVLVNRDFNPNEQLRYVRNKTWKNQAPKVDAFIKRMVGVS